MSDGGKTLDVGFTSALDKLAEGLSYDELFEVNKKTAQVFVDTVKPMIPDRDEVHEKYHLRESLKIERQKNNSARVGFDKKTKKAAVSRFINDGWDSSWKNKRNGKKIEGLHFWEKATQESENKMNETMTEEVKKIVKRKAGGA